MKYAPTSANSNPARIIFLRTPEAKQRLVPALSPTNVDKTLKAPVTAIVERQPVELVNFSAVHRYPLPRPTLAPPAPAAARVQGGAVRSLARCGQRQGV